MTGGGIMAISATNFGDAGLSGLSGRLLAALMCFGPIILLIAHYAHGAETDDPLLTHVFVLSLAALCVLTLLVTRRRASTIGTLIAILCFVAWVSLGYTGNWFRAKTEIFTLAACGGAFIIGRTAGMESASRHLVWRALIWSLVIYFTFTLIGHINNYTGDTDVRGPYQTVRMRGTFVSPNTLATLAGISALLATARITYTLTHTSAGVQTRNQLVDYVFYRAIGAFTLIILSVSCLWLTSSRAGIATFFVALTILVGAEYRAYRGGRTETSRPQNGKKRYRALRWGIFAMSIAITLLAMNSEIFASRISEVAGDSRSRLDIFQIYISAWLERPWLGYGLGSFNRVNDGLMTLENVAALHNMGAAHNVVLQWLIQQGIIGTALMGTLILSIHIPMVRALSISTPRSKSIIRCALCVSCFVFLHGMVDYALEIPSIIWTFALLLGIAHGRATSLSSS